MDLLKNLNEIRTCSGKRKIYLAISTTLILLCIWHNSRAFFIGFTTATALTYYLFTKEMSLKFLLLTGTLLVGMFLIASFLIKVDSSMGRLLIYKISFYIFQEHWLWGIGSFKVEYLKYQAEYFSRGSYSSKELLLADNTYFAFNDYWQLILKWGVSAIFVLLATGLLLYLVIKRAIENHSSNPPLFLLVSAMLLFSIVIAAIFTHVYDLLIFKCLVVSTFGVVCYFGEVIKVELRYYIGGLISLNLFLFFISLPGEYFSSKTARELQFAKKLWYAGYYSESMELLEELYPKLRQNEEYLSFYGDKLLILNNTKRATHFLQRAIKLKPANHLYQKLGDCYSKMQKFTLAEQAYKMAIFMVPNRFGTRYSLMRFYVQFKRPNEAHDVAEQILKLPIKIPSPSVDYFRREAKLQFAKL